MRKFLFVLLLTIAQGGFCQDRSSDFISRFKIYFNGGNDSSLYVIYHYFTSSDFRKNVTQEKFVYDLEAAYDVSGEIMDYKYTGVNGKLHVYRMEGLLKSFTLSVAVDSEGHVTEFVVGPDNARKPSLDEVIKLVKERRALYDNKSCLVVGVVDNGKLKLEFYGSKEHGSSVAPDQSTIFEIGSMTEVLSGILLHTLLLEGKLKLDDPVNKFLPKENQLQEMRGEQVLIRHLITETTGLQPNPANLFYPGRDVMNPFKSYTTDKLLHAVDSVVWDTKPGTRFMPSLTAQGILCYILTRVSGLSYEELLRQRLVKPLKLGTLGVLEPSPYWAKGYFVGEETHPWDFTDALVCGYGVDASVSAVGKLLKFLMKPDRSPLGKAVKASLVTQYNKGVEQGTYWKKDSLANKKIIWESGHTGGHNAWLGWIEGSEDGVFVLENERGVHAADILGMAWLEKLAAEN